MSISDVSNLVGMSVREVVQLAREGRFPSVRDGEVWRVRRADIQTWIAECGKQTRIDDKAPESLVKPTFDIVDSMDMENYRAQPGNWNVQVNKLSKSSFRSHIRSLQFADMKVYDNRWGAACMVKGQSPEGWLMLGSAVGTERASIHWCGKELDVRNFACSGEEGELDFNSDENAYDIVVLINPELLEEIAGSEAVELIRQRNQLEFSSESGSRFLDVAGGLIDCCESHSLLLERPAVAARARSRMLRAIEDCFASIDPLAQGAESRSLRELAVHVAIEHASHALEHTSAWDMAQAAGVSQKTVETAFRQVLGMTPARYLMLTRLNAAHHQLANGTADELTVLQVAMEWGFSHCGRFSAAYRQLFGELPSQTLRRTSDHA